jgi:co-chaperonin GroES (HSP10)
MKAPHNHIFVTVESETNDVIETKSGVKLFANTIQFHESDESKIINTAVRRHYGTVIAPPSQLTEDSKVRVINPGYPAPGRYIPADDVAVMLRAHIEVDSWSSLNLFVHEWKTCADFIQEVQEGDKIYFHFNTITDHNLVQYLGKKIYKLAYQNAICVVRDIPFTDSNVDKVSQIIPISGHVLIEPKWEDGVTDLGDGKRGKVSASGLISELHDKPKHLEGIVKFVCSPMQGDNIDVEVGDTILYAPHSDWEVEIEGVTYYVMKYWDIEALKKSQTC